MELRRLDTLPLEIISRILCFLGARDVVKSRLVSKLFHGITYDSVIWKTIYANARFPRPPGPFSFQSTRFLEQTLIRSERLEECWTTQPMQAVSSTQIRLQGSALGQPRIIDARWLITFESYRQIVFHDIETRSRQVLWEETGLITFWDVTSVTSTGGLSVYVVFRKNTKDIWRASWRLLEFRVHGESGHLSYSVSLDVPTGARYIGGSVCLISDNTPFLYIMGQDLVFDTRTRTFYEFPEFATELVEIHAHQLFVAPRRVLLTNTHIVVVSYHTQRLAVSSSTVEMTLIQAFVLPEDCPAGNSTAVLRLSHEGITPDHLANLALTRNSTIDSITEFTSLRFLRLQPESNRLHFSCVDLTLPRSHSNIIVALSIDVNDIFTVESGIHDPIMSPTGYHIEASDDGHVRGFCRNRAENNNANTSLITKFTIDATGDKCVAAVGQAALPRWIHNEAPPHFSVLSFDGIVGRCCFLKSGHDWRLHGFVDVAVVDIK
ncbi:hypothetical protein EV363DRAFT_1366835 [Boletus edulis]|nr:hypothetical protein EV363DRAFT_1366835 [Boletus edulis]